MIGYVEIGLNEAFNRISQLASTLTRGELLALDADTLLVLQVTAARAAFLLLQPPTRLVADERVWTALAAELGRSLDFLETDQAGVPDRQRPT